MTKWFEEELERKNGRIMKIEYNKILDSCKSFFQKIDVYETKSFGKMLVHDDVIMLTEFDESGYHEMISHVALNVHPNPEKVLIIGGGDGGTLTEVLKHSRVKIANLCEIDENVVNICKKHFPEISQGFSDSRSKLFIGNGAEFVERYTDYYDIIIVDSSDPIGPAEVLFQEKFYKSMCKALKKDGIVITQSESFFYHDKTINKISDFCKILFSKYFYYYTLVPTYPSGIIGFSFCSNKYDPVKDFKIENIENINSLKYYNHDIHKAAFLLPEKYKKLFK